MGYCLGRWRGPAAQPFIRTCFGVDRPKQYCALINHRSMLYHTLRRAERLIPPTHLFVIITDPHLRYAPGGTA